MLHIHRTGLFTYFILPKVVKAQIQPVPDETSGLVGDERVFGEIDYVASFTVFWKRSRRSMFPDTANISI